MNNKYIQNLLSKNLFYKHIVYYFLYKTIKGPNNSNYVMNYENIFSITDNL